METSTMLPKAPRPTIDEDALASQVLDIIGGVTFEALQRLEESEDRDVWLMEEGDDSVFYSDEDQAHQDVKTNTSRDFGASECKHQISSVTADEPIHNPGEDSMTDKESSEMEKGVTRQVILTEQEEERQELKAPKTEPMDQSEAADPAAQSHRTPDNSVSTCRESLQLNCTRADMQTQLEQSTVAGKANQQAEKEEEVINAQTPNLEPFDVTNEESQTRLNGEAEVPEQMSGAELQVSGDRQLQVDQKPQQDHNDVHVPMGFHQNTSPGHCSLPLLKKSGRQESFNHLSSSKYSTVSYRKIRRGNTRQKIEKFEYMMMNL